MLSVASPARTGELDVLMLPTTPADLEEIVVTAQLREC